MSKVWWWILIAANVAIMVIGLCSFCAVSTVYEPKSVRRQERREITLEEMIDKLNCGRKGVRLGGFYNMNHPVRRKAIETLGRRRKLFVPLSNMNHPVRRKAIETQRLQRTQQRSWVYESPCSPKGN